MNSIYAKNKKALHDYEILDTYEAGIALTGDEVKSIKLSQSNLKGSFIDVENDEAYLNDCHISKYKLSSNKTLDPVRKRKLILHRKEIAKIDQAISTKGITAFPIEFYGKQGLVKVKIAIGRGKKLYDKRETLKRKTQDMEVKKAIKKFS